MAEEVETAEPRRRKSSSGEVGGKEETSLVEFCPNQSTTGQLLSAKGRKERQRTPQSLLRGSANGPSPSSEGVISTFLKLPLVFLFPRSPPPVDPPRPSKLLSRSQLSARFSNGLVGSEALPADLGEIRRAREPTGVGAEVAGEP
jgi:hypothetical protein